MKNLIFIASVALCLLGCKKENDQPAEPDQATIEQYLEGRWIGTLELEIPGSLGLQYQYIEYDITLDELTLGEKAGNGIVSWVGGNNCQVDWHYTAFSGTQATFTETSPCWEDYTAYARFKDDDFNTLSIIMPDEIDYPGLSWLGILERQ